MEAVGSNAPQFYAPSGKSRHLPPQKFTADTRKNALIFSMTADGVIISIKIEICPLKGTCPRI